jgi:hypothetical protein
MINKEKYWAKALCFRSLNYPGLKAGVIDNETFTDFSPKSLFLIFTSISNIAKNFWYYLSKPILKINFYPQQRKEKDQIHSLYPAWN